MNPSPQSSAVQVGLRTLLLVVLKAPDSYGLVLALLIVSFILAPLGAGSDWLWVRVLVQGVTMLFALHTARAQRRTMRLAAGLFGISMVLALTVVVSQGTRDAQGTIEALIALLLAVTGPAILRRILTSGTVDGEVIIGALDVYIIFGMFFSSLYASIGSFSASGFFTTETNVNAGSYQFFSFVTLTTVGYGNLVPAGQLGQSLAVLEALFGQIYLVTLVARLVSNLQPGNRRRAIERLEEERRASAGVSATSAGNTTDRNAEADRGEAADTGAR
jgi:hypothetical protein